jgi:hypothetical protein
MTTTPFTSTTPFLQPIELPAELAERIREASTQVGNGFHSYQVADLVADETPAASPLDWYRAALTNAVDAVLEHDADVAMKNAHRAQNVPSLRPAPGLVENGRNQNADALTEAVEVVEIIVQTESGVHDALDRLPSVDEMTDLVTAMQDIKEREDEFVALIERLPSLDDLNDLIEAMSTMIRLRVEIENR